MIETITLIRKYTDSNTHLTLGYTDDGLGNLIFDYAELTTESKGEIMLTYDDVKSLKRILTSKELNSKCI